ncbi:MAG: hypothetical protein Ct9H300mP14_15090 [Gammaproteobacteria bacterium]|nr:MAG: hypothetical protein Ct9H300mP14_15090 [Gammaproteobacteria bacterium]
MEADIDGAMSEALEIVKIGREKDRDSGREALLKMFEPAGQFKRVCHSLSTPARSDIELTPAGSTTGMLWCAVTDTVAISNGISRSQRCG